MNETVWVAIIAVGGTALGAAIGPVLNLVRDATSSKSDEKSKKIRAAAGFSLALQKYAQTDPNRFDGYIVREKRSDAIEARFRLARVIPKRSGQVDRFAEAAIEVIAGRSDVMSREVAAQHAALRLLDWARGDIHARELKAFRVEPNGNEFEIV